jgi:hemolysin III
VLDHPAPVHLPADVRRERMALDAPLGSPSRPVWRGRLHLYALILAVPALVLLAVQARGARARAAVIVYAVGLCSMLAVSTAYHRWVHTIRARDLWRRADHATIFAAIAGTMTALALNILGTLAATVVLVLIWGVSLWAAAVKVLRFDRSHRFGSVMYIVTSWTGLMLVPVLWSHGEFVALSLLIAGGVVYTAGAYAFAHRWPTLRPSTFSYHEVWHACTIAAAGLHLGAVWAVST